MTADFMAVIVILDHTGDRGSRQDQCIFAREPFEAQHDVRNFTLPDRTSFKKPKSKATLARDRKRMQKFREDKDACSALPFFPA